MNPHGLYYMDFIDFDIYEIKNEIEDELKNLESKELNEKWEKIKNNGYYNVYYQFFCEIEKYKDEHK